MALVRLTKWLLGWKSPYDWLARLAIELTTFVIFRELNQASNETINSSCDWFCGD